MGERGEEDGEEILKGDRENGARRVSEEDGKKWGPEGDGEMETRGKGDGVQPLTWDVGAVALQAPQGAGQGAVSLGAVGPLGPSLHPRGREPHRGGVCR